MRSRHFGGTGSKTGASIKLDKDFWVPLAGAIIVLFLIGVSLYFVPDVIKLFTDHWEQAGR